MKHTSLSVCPSLYGLRTEVRTYGHVELEDEFGLLHLPVGFSDEEAVNKTNQHVRPRLARALFDHVDCSVNLWRIDRHTPAYAVT